MRVDGIFDVMFMGIDGILGMLMGVDWIVRGF